MPSTDFEATPETALIQVLTAFGYGVGGLHISHAAARAGVDRFRPVVEKNIGEWDANVTALVGYATRIGRVTAFRTLARGATTVSARDLLGALAAIEESRETEFFGGCPFFHH
jgi:hypothetical protein